jgi:hypothetical protein
LRVQIRLARRHQPCDRAQHRDVVGDHAFSPYLADVSAGLVIGEDRGEALLDLIASRHLAAVEPDGIAVVGKQGGIPSRVVPVPGIEQAVVQGRDLFHTIGPRLPRGLSPPTFAGSNQLPTAGSGMNSRTS